MSKIKQGSTGATAQQLRDDIDSGRTRDKVPAADPATAPLGTDAEAGGASPRPDLVDEARRIEGPGRGQPKGPAAAAAQTGPSPSAGSNKRKLPIAMAAVLVAAIGFIAFLGL